MTEISIRVDGGQLTALDHGGTGQPVLLVHGSGHNAAAWGDVAAALVPEHRVVAVDLRGHGQSNADSATAEQYWQDLATVVRALGWQRPVLAGHSTGGYAVTAVAAAGLVTPAALCVVDGLVLDDRTTTARALARFRTPEAAAELVRVFGYGLEFDAAGMHAWIDAQVAAAPADPLNAGADPRLVHAVAARAFRPAGPGRFVRRPTTAEIAATTTADLGAPVYPGVDIYDRVTCPLTIVLPDGGFYAHRRDEVARIVGAAPGRRLVELVGGHNVVMTHPAEVAAVIRKLACH
ncbi:alpha/beta fold hydrolase [Polyangium aurulentum]|uniref:alpha/beta fold hydrolase n=1 Tax=Polyangium aurulentum TaxID=2567896 RepID=UPI00146CF807|nr:alpha/beta hydrolase [Polyangium aurulentum]UQA60527.1 alpha/beta hydrolase [Polyangium aurulentum]